MKLRSEGPKKFFSSEGYNKATSVVYVGEFLINSILIGLRFTLAQRNTKSEEKQEQT